MKYWYVLVAWIFVGIFIVQYSHKKNKKIIDRLNEEYPILQYSDSLNGTIIGMYDPASDGFRSSSASEYLTVGSKRVHIIAEEAIGVTKKEIGEIVEVRDYLKKAANNDTVFVQKKGGERFVLLRRDKVHD